MPMDITMDMGMDMVITMDMDMGKITYNLSKLILTSPLFGLVKTFRGPGQCSPTPRKVTKTVRGLMIVVVGGILFRNQGVEVLLLLKEPSTSTNPKE